EPRDWGREIVLMMESAPLVENRNNGSTRESKGVSLVRRSRSAGPAPGLGKAWMSRLADVSSDLALCDWSVAGDRRGRGLRGRAAATERSLKQAPTQSTRVPKESELWALLLELASRARAGRPVATPCGLRLDELGRLESVPAERGWLPQG